MTVTSHASSMKLLLLPVIVPVSLPLTTGYKHSIVSVSGVAVCFLARSRQCIKFRSADVQRKRQDGQSLQVTIATVAKPLLFDCCILRQRGDCAPKTNNLE